MIPRRHTELERWVLLGQPWVEPESGVSSVDEDQRMKGWGTRT